jgi:hypothetical protein
VIRTHTFSEAGGHATNEDAFALRELPDGIGGWIVCLADGQGGQARAAEAAQLACRTAAETAIRRGSGFDADVWKQILTTADRAVAFDDNAGFATLLGFSIRWNHVVGASCGDSAVLAVCSSREMTELTRLQFKNPPVGSGEAVFIPFEAQLVRPWKVLAMTDGVWKYAGWHRIHELAAKLAGEELLAALQSAARMPGNGQFQDDFTVVLIEAD